MRLDYILQAIKCSAELTNLKVYNPPSCLAVPITSQELIKKHTECLASVLKKFPRKQGNQDLDGYIYNYWVGTWDPG